MTAPETKKSNVIIGIDLGTTYSCLSVWKDGAPVVIPSASGRTMPSWVAFKGDEKIVGAGAKSQASQNPTNTVYDIKRILGRSFHDPVVQQEKKTLPYKIIEGSNGEPKVVVDWTNKNKELSPEEVSAMILGELRMAAEEFLGHEVTDAVVTVPAHFNNLQRQATKHAGRIAGLNIRRIINEPTAAALAYGLHSATEKPNVLIFDLGGGTFDVSCLEMDEGVLEVKATGGDTHLGGEDLDQTVVDWCCGLFKEQHDAKKAQELKSSKRSMAILKGAVEDAKKELSTAQSVDIKVDKILDDINFKATLDRATFISLNKELFKRCIDTVKSVLVDAETELEEVTDIVLVGGSTRVPFLQDSLYELFGKRLELCKKVHPDEAVAIGAAVQGHILASGGTGGGGALSTESQELLLLDVTPLSLGIELQGRVMSTLIKRNSAIPCKKTRTYSTVEDNQTSIDVVVYEGERACVDSNNQLGSFVITGIEKAKQGEPKVDVSFSLDANGILSVSAKDQVTGAEANAIIKNEKGRMSDADVERMVADAEKYRTQDKELAKKHAYKNKLEQALIEAQEKATGDDAVTELKELVDWMDLDSAEASLEDMKKRMHHLEEKYGIEGR
jgi:heat shock protein 1/8